MQAYTSFRNMTKIVKYLERQYSRSPGHIFPASVHSAQWIIRNSPYQKDSLVIAGLLGRYGEVLGVDLPHGKNVGASALKSLGFGDDVTEPIRVYGRLSDINSLTYKEVEELYRNFYLEDAQILNLADSSFDPETYSQLSRNAFRNFRPYLYKYLYKNL